MTARGRPAHTAVVALFLTAWTPTDALPASAIKRQENPARAVEHTPKPSITVAAGRQDQAKRGASAGTATSLPALERKIAVYRAKLKKSPRLYPVWAQLGGAYLRRARFQSSWEDLQHAERALERSLAIQRNPVAWRWLAAVRLDQHRFPEAAALARQAVEAWEADGMSRAIWSDALLAMGRYDKARAVFGDQSQDFYSIVGRSRLLFLTNRPQEAIQQLQRALGILRRDPSEQATEAKAWCHLMIGGYYYEIDQPSNAKDAYARALVFDPERIDGLEHVAEWEATYGKKETAVRMYRDIIATTPRPQEKLALGVLLLDLGVGDEGESLINEAIESWQRRLEKGDISVRRELALALLDHGGDMQHGLRLARADLEIRQDALASDTLAWALYKTGAHEEAKATLGRALKHGAVYRIVREHAKAIGLFTADKDGSGINDPNTHQCCYKIKARKLEPPANVEIEDQFGTLQLEVKKAKLLCQPCTKTELP